jgi:hypothetical protein
VIPCRGDAEPARALPRVPWQKMPDRLYSEAALEVFDRLPATARTAIEARLAYLQAMPRLYPLTTDPRFPGCRSFWVDPCYRVYYMVAAAGDDVFIVAVMEEDVVIGFAAAPPPAPPIGE